MLSRHLCHEKCDMQLWKETREYYASMCGRFLFVACSRDGSPLPTHLPSVCGQVHRSWRK
jgi:hypothetical protein